MLVFFDTSAFAKRYIDETGTGKVLEWCDKATEIGLAGIALPEIISAFCRLHREARITDAQYRQLKSLLMGNYSPYLMLASIGSKASFELQQSHFPESKACFGIGFAIKKA